jgi:anti-sigma-K factor RskA
MSGDTERLSRAGSYVLGLMSEADRERAERDLEIDPAFRDAVVRVAERIRIIEPAETRADDRWKLISGRISEMPQMRGASGKLAALPRATTAGPKVETIGRGLHAVPSRRAAIFAISLIVTFAAGYLTAMWRM